MSQGSNEANEVYIKLINHVTGAAYRFGTCWNHRWLPVATCGSLRRPLQFEFTSIPALGDAQVPMVLSASKDEQNKQK